MVDDVKGNELVSAFDQFHDTRFRSSTLEHLWQAAYGDDYPAVARPNAFYSLAVLRQLRDALKLREDQTLVDLGCGYGNAGMWIAQQLGVRLIGVDASPAGIASAVHRAAELGFHERSQFQVGDVLATGLPDASCDAAMSLDVLLFVPDQAAAVREAARVLRSGSRFGFTSWEQPAGLSRRLDALQLADYRPILESAGFEMEVYDEPADWRLQQRTLLEAIVAHEREIAEEMGSTAATRFSNMARGALKDMPSRRYMFGVGRRK